MEQNGFKEKSLQLMSNNSCEKIKDFIDKHGGKICKTDFDIFHYSVQQKLWEANYFFDKINNLKETDFLNVPIDTYIVDSTKELRQPAVTLNKISVCQYTSLYITGYFISLYSTFDSLANEINVLYRVIDTKPSAKGRKRPDVQWSTVFNELKQHYSNSYLFKRLESINKNRTWWNKLQSYRHSLSHEIIVFPKINTSSTLLEEEKILSICLPDNPKKRPFTYSKNIEPIEFVKSIDIMIAPTIEKIYKSISEDIRNKIIDLE